MSPQKARPLRADAQINRDRLLGAAARAFAREGPEASLKGIAKDAGVGIGTLYRRFPTRDRLIEATYRDEVARLCAAAPELLEAAPAAQALRTWMGRFVDFMATKHRMTPALRTVLVSDGDQRMRTRDLLTDAVATLLAAGVAGNELRPRIDPDDVLMAVGGVILIAGEPSQRDQANRLLDLLLDGLRYQATPIAPRPARLRPPMPGRYPGGGQSPKFAAGVLSTPARTPRQDTPMRPAQPCPVSCFPWPRPPIVVPLRSGAG